MEGDEGSQDGCDSDEESGDESGDGNAEECEGANSDSEGTNFILTPWPLLVDLSISVYIFCLFLLTVVDWDGQDDYVDSDGEAVDREEEEEDHSEGSESNSSKCSDSASDSDNDSEEVAEEGEGCGGRCAIISLNYRRCVYLR